MNGPTTVFTQVAMGVVRGWTRLYTWGLPPVLRDARQAEIASDLWEATQEPDAHRGLSPGLQMLARLLIGIPDDLSWRVEHTAPEGRPPLPIVTLTAVGALLLLVALWVIPPLLTGVLPVPPDAPGFTARSRMAAMPAPPPPPPPPCPPPALGGCKP